MNYKIIQNIDELQKFIDWLPELNDGEKYMVILSARRKYGKTPNMPSDCAWLKRFTTTKKDLINKLRKLEVPVGTYFDGKIELNQDSLAVYICPNPRDMHKAGIKTISALSNLLAEGRKIYNPEKTALTVIQDTGKNIFMDLDIDINPNQSLSPDEVKTWLLSCINEEAIAGIVKTKGGFHALIQRSLISADFAKVWWNIIHRTKDERFKVTNNGDNPIPLAGCTQSDTYPILL